ncbi:Decaprenyl diphosphate synthase [Bartonella ancashensis]|uniref:Decaprenyl diphosphate synthase n=1 Tax=Bartonella ancashensis TaxID=1318743 RepID=A0A0M5KST9_9HYPH|nr:polyprenyl synthetase family protein [Bartonella ancashensis]ALE04078.1 Decaprenyl diphosphate synthase [Bartonella ancashensis]
MNTLTKQHEEKDTQISLHPLIQLTKNDMGCLNELIMSTVKSDVEIIPEICNYLISSGGKRLRPMITIASARMFEYPGREHIKLATAVEFMHTATLLHDDVVDESDLRRGESTVRILWGNQESVLVGDFLLGQAFKMIVSVGSMEALTVLSNAAAIIAEGEVMQLATAKNINNDIENYLKIINAKTAALFSAAAEVGPIIAGYGNEERSALRQYGTSLGLAFQLIDDVLDYGGQAQHLGKNIGDDFREGKVTMPVILSYERGNVVEKKFLEQTFQNGHHSDEALMHTQHLMEKYNSLIDTVEYARTYGKQAIDALSSVKEGDFKKALIEIIDFCITRVN